MVTSVDWGRYNNPWFLGTILGKKETSPLDPDNHATVLVTGTGWKRTLFLLGGWILGDDSPDFWWWKLKFIWLGRISRLKTDVLWKTLGRFSSTRSTIPWFSSLSSHGDFFPTFCFHPQPRPMDTMLWSGRFLTISFGTRTSARNERIKNTHFRISVRFRNVSIWMRKACHV